MLVKQNIVFVIDDEIVWIHEKYAIMTTDHLLLEQFLEYLNKYQNDHDHVHDEMMEYRFHLYRKIRVVGYSTMRYNPYYTRKRD
jgi:hypothetical protein